MTPTWRAANSREVGLEVRVDTLRKIFGRHNGSEELPMITFGSHIDLVPGGGIYDGMIAGIEVAQAPWPTAPGCSFSKADGEPPHIEAYRQELKAPLDLGVPGVDFLQDSTRATSDVARPLRHRYLS